MLMFLLAAQPPATVAHFVLVGAVLLACGLVCMATKRNTLGVLMGSELVLTAANINFIALGSPYLRPAGAGIGLDGQLCALVVMVLAAAETAVALAIALNFYNTSGSIDVDQARELKG